MKPCARCKVRPRVVRARVDSYCGPCRSQISLEWQAKGLMSIERRREIARNCYRNNAADRMKDVARWRKENRTAHCAQKKLRYAVKTGKLIRPTRCERCRKPAEKIDGHHPDYSKPLEVLWLCKPCHRAVEKI